jgi:ABC-type transport system involved in multi-copper enzyme maturation permease subunit
MTTATTTAAPTAPVSKNAESALPTHAKVPSRIDGPRPTTGVPFGRLIHVELRKMLDTRAGRWLIIGIGVAIAAALVILFFVDGGQHRFEDYLQATTMPTAIILPVVGILAVTSEWSQRTGLVTFTLEPRRVRVGWAKFLASMLVAVGAFVLSLGLAALAHQAAVTLRGITPGWDITALTVTGAALYVFLGLAQGVAFGMLFKNTPAAIVACFALPTVWGILTGLIASLRTTAEWLDLNRTMGPLFMGSSLTGEQWAQLGTSVAVWVVLPLAIGMWRLTRAEVK